MDEVLSTLKVALILEVLDGIVLSIGHFICPLNQKVFSFVSD